MEIHRLGVEVVEFRSRVLFLVLRSHWICSCTFSLLFRVPNFFEFQIESRLFMPRGLELWIPEICSDFSQN